MNTNIITCGELAHLLGVTNTSTVYWRRKGLPVLGRVGHAFIVDTDEALEWVAGNTTKRAEALDLLGRTDEEVAA